MITNAPQEPEEPDFTAFDELIAKAPSLPPAAELIPIHEKHGQKSVNARDLHRFLEVGKDFSTWIADRIQQFGFLAGQDYSPISGNRSDGLPGKRKTEYALSLDMAKELSMVERTEKGKQARQYFIACEKQLREQLVAQPFPVPQTLTEALRLALSQAETIEQQAAELAIAAPKAEALDLLSISDGSSCISRAAKSLGVTKIKDLFEWLHAKKWIFRNHAGEWVAHQDRIRSGHLEDKVTTIEKGDGSSRVCHQTLVTPKGLAALAKHFSQSVA